MIIRLPSYPLIRGFLSSQSLARWWSGYDLKPAPGIFSIPAFPVPVISDSCHTKMQRASRGEPRLLSAHDRQIYGVTMMDRGLYPVLRTRPGFPPPHLPALYLSVRGIPVRRPTLLPPASFRNCLATIPLPLATLRLHQAGSGLYLKYVSLFQISPFSSRALPGTQPGAGDGLGKAVPFLEGSI